MGIPQHSTLQLFMSELIIKYECFTDFHYLLMTFVMCKQVIYLEFHSSYDKTHYTTVLLHTPLAMFE